MRREIARFLAKRGQDDLLLLYYSGHGLLDERGALYLAAHDTEQGFLSLTAIPAAFVTGEMDQCPSRRQILILDCCYSGAFERGAKGSTDIPAATFEGNGVGRIVLTASSSTELAWEETGADGTADTSVFTRHLIEGLETGAADLDDDGHVGVDEDLQGNTCTAGWSRKKSSTPESTQVDIPPRGRRPHPGAPRGVGP